MVLIFSSNRSAYLNPVYLHPSQFHLHRSDTFWIFQRFSPTVPSVTWLYKSGLQAPFKFRNDRNLQRKSDWGIWMAWRTCFSSTSRSRRWQTGSVSHIKATVSFLSEQSALKLTNFDPQMQNLDELEEQVVVSLLAEVVDKLQKQNQKLSTKQAQIQVGW